MPSYDAILLVSYGGPEGPGDVMPFLEKVVRDKNVSPARLKKVAEHYELFGGVSPINAECRALLTAIVGELNTHGPALPVYWGNRYWHPMLAETIEQMAEDGITRALAFATSAYSSYSSCRQYLEAIEEARQHVGANAPTVDKIRAYYNHPGFVEPMVDRTAQALRELPEQRREHTPLIYTAHSLPVAMAKNCAYQRQLEETCRLVSEQLGRSRWELVYQSRSGPPSVPWLEPVLEDRLRQMASDGEQDVVIVPVGFVCEHMEIVYDLDVAARNLCEELGLNMVRGPVVGCHRRFVTMIRELINERIEENPTRLALGNHGPSSDTCPSDCCAPR